MSAGLPIGGKVLPAYVGHIKLQHELHVGHPTETITLAQLEGTDYHRRRDLKAHGQVVEHALQSEHRRWKPSPQLNAILSSLTLKMRKDAAYCPSCAGWNSWIDASEIVCLSMVPFCFVALGAMLPAPPQLRYAGRGHKLNCRITLQQ